MKDQVNQTWDKAACVTIPELEDNAYSHTVDCVVPSFSLEYHARDRGNTEIVINRIEKYAETSTSSSTTSTSTTSDTKKSTATSSSVSTSTSQTMVERQSAINQP